MKASGKHLRHPMARAPYRPWLCLLRPTIQFHLIWHLETSLYLSDLICWALAEIDFAPLFIRRKRLTRDSKKLMIGLAHVVKEWIQRLWQTIIREIIRIICARLKDSVHIPQHFRGTLINQLRGSGSASTWALKSPANVKSPKLARSPRRNRC